MRTLPILLAAVVMLFLVPSLALAADKPGQADLDAATDLQITAETLGDLEKVIKLAESALAKGLDKDQEDFAKTILGAALYQHANRNAESIIERRRRGGQFQTIRQQSLKDLEKAKKYDPTLPDIYTLEAKLYVLPGPGSDVKAAETAASEAIKLLSGKNDPKQLSKAYILRAQITEDKDRKLADFDAAAKADPSNSEDRKSTRL